MNDYEVFGAVVVVFILSFWFGRSIFLWLLLLGSLDQASASQLTNGVVQWSGAAMSSRTDTLLPTPAAGYRWRIYSIHIQYTGTGSGNCWARLRDSTGADYGFADCNVGTVPFGARTYTEGIIFPSGSRVDVASGGTVTFTFARIVVAARLERAGVSEGVGFIGWAAVAGFLSGGVFKTIMNWGRFQLPGGRR